MHQGGSKEFSLRFYNIDNEKYYNTIDSEIHKDNPEFQ